MVKQCSLVDVYRCTRGSCYFHCQSRYPHGRHLNCGGNWYLVTVMRFYRTTRSHIPEDSILDVIVTS
jgi:hypothetical protein